MKKYEVTAIVGLKTQRSVAIYYIDAYSEEEARYEVSRVSKEVIDVTEVKK